MRKEECRDEKWKKAEKIMNGRRLSS